MCTSSEGIYSFNKFEALPKWDWYDASGGRWREIFKYKDYDVIDAEEAESEDDEIPKSGYDFEAMCAAAIRQEHERWDVMEPLLAKYTWEPWERVRERFSDEDINHARGVYHSQKGLQRVRKISNFSSFEDMDRYLLTNRQDAVALAAMKVVPCRAYIKDGRWHDRWNGQDDIPAEQWFEELNEMIESLPDDTVLTFVDCHI